MIFLNRFIFFLQSSDHDVEGKILVWKVMVKRFRLNILSLFQESFDNCYINNGLKEFGLGLSSFSRYSRCFLSCFCCSTVRFSMCTF